MCLAVLTSTGGVITRILAIGDGLSDLHRTNTHAQVGREARGTGGWERTLMVNPFWTATRRTADTDAASPVPAQVSRGRVAKGTL